MFKTISTREELPSKGELDSCLQKVHQTEKLLKKKFVSELKQKNLSDDEIIRIQNEIDINAKTNRQPPSKMMSKRNKNYHYIHGKPYDLRKFFKNHPGGADILKMTQGIVDATPLFESYHAMANRSSIMKQLERYEVKDLDEDELTKYAEDKGMYTFKEDGFYRTVTRRVREHFAKEGENVEKMSLTSRSKADIWWLLKISTQGLIFLVMYYVTFFMQNLPTPVAMVSAIVAANFFIQFGFTVMHDGSHYAIAARNHWINGFLSRLWDSIALWNFKTWALHHAVLHHSFTGSSDLDPDEFHAIPMIRKTAKSNRNSYLPVVRFLGETFGIYGWAVAAAAFYVFAPGMWLGQAFVYFMFQINLGSFKNLWGMDYEHYKSTDAFEVTWWEHMLFASQILVHFYRGNLFVTIAYFAALNFSYSMNIVADHDCSGAAISDHVDVDTDMDQDIFGYGKVDWGEVQVRNSSNFVNGFGNDIFAKLNGSINYQIEHHLFPGIGHMHLPKIAPIVKMTCEEYDIPYAAFPSFKAAWLSFLVTVRSFLTETDEHNFPTRD